MLDSFFFENLPKSDAFLQAKRDKKFWLKYSSLRPLPRIIAPIHHIEEKHWSLCIIDLNIGTVLHYDSIEDGKRYVRTVNRVKEQMFRAGELTATTSTPRVSNQLTDFFPIPI